METKEYDGKKFSVFINRGCAERRYILATLEEDGSFLHQNNPMYRKDFESHYGFSPDWPHETIKKIKR